MWTNLWTIKLTLFDWILSFESLPIVISFFRHESIREVYDKNWTDFKDFGTLNVSEHFGYQLNWWTEQALSYVLVQVSIKNGVFFFKYFKHRLFQKKFY